MKSFDCSVKKDQGWILGDSMSKIWTEFNAALAMAKALAKSRGVEVLILVADGGWVINEYCSLVNEPGELEENETSEHEHDYFEDGSSSTRLIMPDWGLGFAIAGENDKQW